MSVSVTITDLNNLPQNASILALPSGVSRNNNTITYTNARGYTVIQYYQAGDACFKSGDIVEIAFTVDSAPASNRRLTFDIRGVSSGGSWETNIAREWAVLSGLQQREGYITAWTNTTGTAIARIKFLADAWGFACVWRGVGTDWAVASTSCAFTISYITTQFEPVDPYSEIDGESDIPGDTVAIPGDPALSVTSTGIVGLFSPTAAQMQLLADFMWTDFGGTGTTVEDILSEIVQALKRSISNPLDYVIGLNIIPSQGLSKGSSKVIRFGFFSSNVSMPELTSQFFTVDCGTLSFDYLCGNTFLDYAPYSKFSIYLPYIGVKEVDANDFVGHTIGVKYKGDVVTGGLTAFITKDGSVMYQYSGSCALNIPLTADNWGSTISAAINVATAVIGAASMPGAGLAASAAKAGKAAVGATVSNVAANPSLISPQVARSGAISGGAGAIGVQHPYVIREAVRFHSTAKFNTLTGYPSYYFRSLADVTGYTVVYDCHLENIPATDGEIREIEQLLEGGVIL